MKRLLYIWLFVLSALSAVAQERKDSIQILFPDSASTTLQLDYLNTSQIVDSIIASLALPQNAQRPIFLSTVTPPQGVVSFYNGRDSIALERLQTVALLLSDHGIADSLICYNIETYDSLNVADTLQSATFSTQSEGVWLHMPGGEWLGTGTYDISPLAQQAPDSVAADSVVVSAHRKAKSPKTTVSRPACSIQKSRPSFRSSFRSSSTPTPLASHPQKAKDNTFINNARTMDSLTNLVRLLQDTIAQYRQQIADLRQIQYQAQIANTQTDGFNHTLYVVLVVLLVICLLLLLYFIYERRRTKEEMEALREEVIYNMMSLQHVATQHVDNQQISTPPQQGFAGDSAKHPATPATASSSSSSPSSSPAPSSSPSSSFEGIYGGKALYESLVAGTCETIDKWSSVDVCNFIEYYRLNHREFVDGLEANYNSLSRNHKMFLILLDMGKNDSEIQQLMNITQTTIRSIRFRIRAKRKEDGQSNDPQTTINF